MTAGRYVPDSVLMLSSRAWWDLVHEAKVTGRSVEQVLRDRAYRLSLATKPAFRMSGGEIVREVRVGIIHEVLDRLEAMCDRLDVPVESLGELIATWHEEVA